MGKIKRNVLMLGLILSSMLMLGGGTTTTVANDSHSISKQKNELRKFSEVFRSISEKINPSVVSVKCYINTENKVTKYRKRYSYGYIKEEKVVERHYASGTGFVVSEDGHIITNHHVIDNHSRVEIVFNDGRSFDAYVIDSDQVLDIAVLKLKVKVDNLPTPCKFADSNKTKVGDWVLAFGNPYGLTNTVSQGIISFKGRFINKIQITAAINPGNSGGPLVNLDGEIIGVNNSIITTTGSNIGLGLSIPSNLAKKLYDDAVKYNSFRKTFIGIDARIENKKVTVLKTAVQSPARLAGILNGDVILKLNNQIIYTPHQMYGVFSEIKDGKTITAIINRNGITMAFQIKTEDKISWMLNRLEKLHNDLGIKTVLITKANKHTLGTSISHGALITGYIITPGKPNPARKAGLKIGDIIIEANHLEITSMETYLRAMTLIHRRYFRVEVLRKSIKNEDPKFDRLEFFF